MTPEEREREGRFEEGGELLELAAIDNCWFRSQRKPFSATSATYGGESGNCHF